MERGVERLEGDPATLCVRMGDKSMSERTAGVRNKGESRSFNWPSFFRKFWDAHEQDKTVTTGWEKDCLKALGDTIVKKISKEEEKKNKGLLALLLLTWTKSSPCLSQYPTLLLLIQLEEKNIRQCHSYTLLVFDMMIMGIERTMKEYVIWPGVSMFVFMAFIWILFHQQPKFFVDRIKGLFARTVAK